MVTGKSAPRIFISYSHEDEPWKDRLLTHLRALERIGTVNVWDTAALRPGSEWSKEIDQAIREASVAVLLISPAFLASDFVVNRELPALLQRREREGLAILPVLISPSHWSAVPALTELQFLNDPGKPIAQATPAEQDAVYAAVSQQIGEVAQAIAQRLSSAPRPDTFDNVPQNREEARAAKRRHIFISHSKTDGDFAELLKLKLDQQGYEGWIDADRLDPGIDWRTEIDEAIKSAAAVIAVMSPEARTSEYVTYEWAFAWGCGKKVIPIMLLQTTLHPRLATLQYLDFTTRIARPWARLFSALSGLNGSREL